MEGQPSVVLIDDIEDKLREFQDALRSCMGDDDVAIKTWQPVDGQEPLREFSKVTDYNTVLVVTDYDLTKGGLTGLFGASIVSWCQARFIPVGNFSRGNQANLPTEANLFELRVPTAIDEAAHYTANMFRGFKELRDQLDNGVVDLVAARSPAEVLASILGRPDLESQLSLYMSLLGAANASLLDSLRKALSRKGQVPDSEKIRLLSYVIGHVLANAVMRYPGPILSEDALCAYLGTSTQERATLAGIFNAETRYDGAFSSGMQFYWREKVDSIIEDHASTVEDAEFETSGEFNRAVIETMIKKSLARHKCDRCEGIKGGYLCPFTERPVCERASCSVAANSWIPPGADLCRVERDFYEEWAPLLGL